jgi:hypothetical protein
VRAGSCVNLRELCLINTPGLVVPDLSFARHLTRVTLTDQRLTSLTAGSPAGLGDLPHLRELYLQNNHLERMDGLGGCTGLHKLWMCSNQLRQLEGLGKLLDLRELWLQDNKFEDMGAGDGVGLSACINLQVLALAGNPLSACEALGLTVLSTLPALHDLSFADPMFGTSPVVSTNGYRDSIIMQCRQVQMLDGVRVTPGARAEAEDGYLRSVLEFNARIDGIRQAAAADAAAAERRMLRNQEAHAAHKAALTQEWEQLVGSVATAQREMAAARDELVATTATRRAELQSQAVELTREYDEAISRQVRLTEAAIEAEDRRLERLENLLVLREDFEGRMAELSKSRMRRPPAQEDGEYTWTWAALARGGRGYRDAVRAWGEAGGAAAGSDSAVEEREVVAAYRLDCSVPGASPAPARSSAEDAAGSTAGEWVAFIGSAAAAEGTAGGGAAADGGRSWEEVRTVVSSGWRSWVARYANASTDGDGGGVESPLVVYRRLPAASREREAAAEAAAVAVHREAGGYPRSTVAVLARLCVEGDRAVQLEAADVDYLSPGELAESVPADADWGAVEAGEAGGAYLLLAAHAHAGVGGGRGDAVGAVRSNPAVPLAGLRASYCVLLAEPGLDEAAAAAESGGASTALGWGLSPAAEAQCAAIEARAAALERLAASPCQSQ